MAREQTNMLKTIQDELVTQIKVQKDLKKQLDERLIDDSEVLLYSVTNRDALNRVQGELFGNGVISHKTYDAITQRLKNIKTTMANNTISDISYTYDNMNNVLSKINHTQNQNQNYTYDEYDRLKTWNNNNDIQEYNYDIYGNMLNNSYNTNMSYNNKNQIVNKITKDNKTYNYTYYENGNILNEYTTPDCQDNYL
jgi:YD repeat-containing protein